jgi:hypothetical protein
MMDLLLLRCKEISQAAAAHTGKEGWVLGLTWGSDKKRLRVRRVCLVAFGFVCR